MRRLRYISNSRFFEAVYLPHDFLTYIFYDEIQVRIKRYSFIKAVCKMNVNKSLDNTRFIAAVIDSTKARFFTLELEQLPNYDFGPNLKEYDALNNPVKEFTAQQLWANIKTGRNRGAGNQAHSYNDHRQNHIIEFERRFAQNISNQIVSLIRVYKAKHLILVAEPQILGLMRESLRPMLPQNLELRELAKDLGKLKKKEIHEYLANKNLLPARKKLSQ